MDSPWYKELQYNSLRVDDTHYDQKASGDFAILANHRVQLPAVIVEVSPTKRFEPYEMGNGSLTTMQDVRFHVLAESAWERNKLMDIISEQDDKNIWLYNVDEVIKKGHMPLDHRGMVATNPKMYPNFVDPTGDGGSRHKTCRFTNTTVTEVENHNPRLYEAVVRSTMEVMVGAV